MGPATCKTKRSKSGLVAVVSGIVIASNRKFYLTADNVIGQIQGSEVTMKSIDSMFVKQGNKEHRVNRNQ